MQITLFTSSQTSCSVKTSTPLALQDDTQIPGRNRGRQGQLTSGCLDVCWVEYGQKFTMTLHSQFPACTLVSRSRHSMEDYVKNEACAFYVDMFQIIIIILILQFLLSSLSLPASQEICVRIRNCLRG